MLRRDTVEDVQRIICARWAEFKCGQVVVLKSGGPKMTVRSQSLPRVECDWFVDGVHHSQTFWAGQITDAENPGSEMVEREWQDHPDHPLTS